MLGVSTGGVVIAQTLIVFYVYMLAHRRSPHRRGLIPRHVIGVSVFTVMAEVVFMALIHDLIRREAPLSFYGPMILVANVVLIVSLHFIFRFDQRRISTSSTPAVEGSPELPMRRAEDLAPPSNRWWGRSKVRSP